jgi:hypothetical protein
VKRLYETIMNGTAGDPRRAMKEQPHDAALLKVLKTCKQAPWEKFRRAGATNQQILTVLKVG